MKQQSIKRMALWGFAAALGLACMFLPDGPNYA
jgi:hypothetical protein